MKKSALILAAALTLAACNKPETPISIADHNTLYAQIEQETATKTYMDANNNVRWSEGDQIVGFMKSSLGLKYQILPSSVDKTWASFENVSGSNGNINAGTEWGHNIVYYPYSDAIEAEKSGSSYSLSVVLPAEQTYAEDSFGNGSMAMVAVSEDNNITFKNVLGGMKLQLKGTQMVTSIKLEGKNSEKLSGAATVTAYTDETKPAITMSSGASTSVTLNCCTGVHLNESTATEFILSLPPMLFSKGFTVTVTDDASQTYTVETDKANTVLRSSLLVMPEISIGASSGEEKEPQEGDYIDEYGVNHGQGVEIDGVVWAPVNCGYHETDFKYGKLYQWGRKYGQGYDGSLYDMNGNKTGTYTDATVPTVKYGPVSLSTGQSESNVDYFYKEGSYPYDWLSSPDDELWNSGTESDPVKTEYDPCPEGWRVPTYEELDELNDNRSSCTTDENGQIGYWFSGSKSYSSSVPRVFFPAAGYRGFYDGNALNRGYCGYYWSSRPSRDSAYYLYFNSSTNMSNGGRADGFSVRCVQDDGELVPVTSVTLNESSFAIDEGDTYTLSASISPSDANHQSAHWWSDDESVVTVDQSGVVTAVSAGTATITAMAGMKTATCTVTVKDQSVTQKGDYIDEYGVNHGQGVEIDGVVWAPVNCGYHETDFKYGKLYQWGRKYGQGYEGDLYGRNGNKTGTYADAAVPTVQSGPVSLSEGQSEDKEDNFYVATSSPWDWQSSPDDYLWNSGTESDPVKTEYDPCPEGWRVPTYGELDELNDNRSSWTTNENGQIGYWFSGSKSYSSSVPRIFFPAAGYRSGYGGGRANSRGDDGYYWSSRPSGNYAYLLYFGSSSTHMDYGGRADGYSVRCVQVID